MNCELQGFHQDSQAWRIRQPSFSHLQALNLAQKAMMNLTESLDPKFEDNLWNQTEAWPRFSSLSKIVNFARWRAELFKHTAHGAALCSFLQHPRP